MLKKIAIGWLILAILGYLVAVVIRNMFVYIPSFMILAAAILFWLLVQAINLIWKLLRGDLKKTYENKRGSFNAIIFLYVILFYIIAGIIDEFLLPDESGFIGLLSNTTTFVFAVLLGWGLIKRAKIKIVVAGGVVFILFIAVLSFVSSGSLKSGEIEIGSSINKLMTLGYLDWTPAEENIDKSGVVQYDPELAFEGLNLYHAMGTQEVSLIDMSGNTVHKWPAQGNIPCFHLGYAELCKNGDLLLYVDHNKLLLLDWDSNIKLEKENMRGHHDVDVSENGQIYVLGAEHALVFWHGIPVPIENDCVIVLTPDGEIKRKVLFYDLVKEQVPLWPVVKVHAGFLKFLKPKNVLRICSLRISEWKEDVLTYVHRDILHSNTLEIMDRDIEGFCKKGDWLVSVRNINLVGVIDPEKEKFVWSWGPGELSLQHHPRLLKNGNVLIFDNGAINGYSRIIELNPLTKQIVWEYKADPPEQFFTLQRGSSQRLPNGNTLIVESNKGHVFEITKEGKIVWEFYTPDVDFETKKRRVIYRMERIADPEIYKLLKR